MPAVFVSTLINWSTEELVVIARENLENVQECEVIGYVIESIIIRQQVCLRSSPHSTTHMLCHFDK